MARSSDVPSSVDELVVTHGKLIRYMITRVSRGGARSDDVPDLLQQVYTRIWEKQYLERVRVLLSERGGSFNTYLWWLVRSVCVNQFRQNLKNPVSTARRVMDPRAYWKTHSSRLMRGVDLERLGIGVDRDFERRYVVKDGLERFAKFVATTKKGAELAATLQHLYDGLETSTEVAEKTGMLRSRAQKQTRELRRLRGVFLRRVS